MYKKAVIVALAATYLSACTTTDPYTGEQKVSNTAGGAAIGAGMGAVAGLLIGNNPVQRRNAALIGAGVGATAAYVGGHNVAKGAAIGAVGGALCDDVRLCQ